MVQETAERIVSNPVVSLLGKGLMGGLSVAAVYMASQFHTVQVRVEDVDKRLTVIESSRRESIANFMRRMDELETQDRVDRATMAKIQQDMATVQSLLASMIRSQDRIERVLETGTKR